MNFSRINRRLRFVAVVAAFGLTLASCGTSGSGGSSDNDKELPKSIEATVLTPAGFLVDYTGLLYGTGGGFFKAAGLDATLEAPAGSAQGLQQVLAGKALVMRGGGVDVMNAVGKQKAPVVAIGVPSHNSPMYLISTADKPIKEPSELTGKVVGVPSRGGAGDQTMTLLLSVGEVDQKTVTRQVTGPGAGSYGLLQQGKMDAYIGTKQTEEDLKAEGLEYHSFAIADYVPVPGQVYITARSNLDDPVKREALRRFLKGARAAYEDVYKQLDANDVSKLIADVAQFKPTDTGDPNAVITALKNSRLSAEKHGADKLLENNPGDWEAGTKMAIDADYVPADSEASDFYTNEIWEEAFSSK